MEKLNGYDEATPITGEYETLEAGGYICEIKDAKVEESKTNKKMLTIAFDIVEGDHAGYYQRRYDEAMKIATPENPAKWRGTYRQLLEGNTKSVGFLKGMMTCLEASNPNFKWDWDEKKLKGLKFGGIFGEEEYEKIDGSVGTIAKLKFIRTVKAVKEGKFKVPYLKKLAKKGDCFEDFASSKEDDLPF